ncbi:MAG: hypothetical protein KFW21_06585 [Spirochaetota bacterium]|nr:hypothetical protein [Spirochaetota bacterium]
MHTRVKSLNINILLFVYIIIFNSPLYSSYLFISSSPLGAKVSIEISNKDSIKIINLGKTPLKITNFLTNTKVIIEKVEYFSSTNTIKKSTKVQNCFFNLVPLTFDIEFPNQSDSLFYANKKPYSVLDGVLALPYGNYQISHDFKKNSLAINYKSPYTPYIAFFSTITVVSTIMAITAQVLAAQSYKEFLKADNSTEVLASLGNVSTWDTVMWSSVGIGTGALIGTIITASLDAKDKKRIKRFNGLNTSVRSTEYISDYQDIILTSTFDDSVVLKKIAAFIKKYPAADSPILSDIYLRRAGIYMTHTKNNNKAIKDLNIIIEKMPTKKNYELATKLLADIYMDEKNYLEAYKYYSESLLVIEIFTYSQLKFLSLKALYNMAQENSQQYKQIFLDESVTKYLKSFSKVENSIVLEWRDIIKKL